MGASYFPSFAVLCAVPLTCITLGALYITMNMHRDSTQCTLIRSSKRFTSSYKSSSFEWNPGVVEWSLPYDECKLCDFTVRNGEHDSTYADLVASVAFQYTFNILPYVRSLRTVGCRASIVIFVDRPNFQNDNVVAAVKCGVRVINVGFPDANSENSNKLFRFNLLYDFLRPREEEFNRILFSDLFDVIFQADPFTPSFTAESFYISTESNILKNEELNQQWVLAVADEETLHRIWDNPIANAGIIAGGVHMFLHFLTEFFKLVDAKFYDSESRIDQPTLNVFIYNTTFCTTIAKCTYSTLTGPYITIGTVARDNGYTYKIGDYTRARDGSYPMVIHQYDRNGPFVDSVIKSCQMEPEEDFEYVRTMFTR